MKYYWLYNIQNKQNTDPNKALGKLLRNLDQAMQANKVQQIFVFKWFLASRIINSFPMDTSAD